MHDSLALLSICILLTACTSVSAPESGISPSQEKKITFFGFKTPLADGWINQTGGTVTVFVPEKTDLRFLVPSMSFLGKSVSPAPESAADFSSPVNFIVTARDGTSRSYTVTVLVDTPLESGSRPIGINIAQVRDWSTELAFTDVFLQSRDWVSFYDGGPWDAGVQIPQDTNGWPLQIPYSDGSHLYKVRTLMLTDIPGAYPHGNYRLTAEGKGKISITGAPGVLSTPLDTKISVTGDYGVTLTIEESDPSDPVRNVHFILPDYADQSPRQTFTDNFLTMVRRFGTVRYMDFLRTCGNQVRTWEQRSTTTEARQSTDKGVAWEYVAELANVTHTDAWVNIPSGADDGYLTSVAGLLSSRLDPSLKIYLEYSNEVWNSIMVQAQLDALAGANTLGYSGDDGEKIRKYTAHRSAAVFAAFANAFGGTSRLVRVLPGQSQNPWVTEQIIGFFKDPLINTSGADADALGIGDYFGYYTANNLYSTYQKSSDVTDLIMNGLREAQEGVYGFSTEVAPNKTLAKKYGLRLLAYEAGTHLAPFGAAQFDDRFVSLLLAAHRDERFYPLLRKHLRNWYTETERDLLCWYSSAGKYSRYGGWGIIEDYTQKTSNRLRALEDEVFRYNR